MSQDMIAGMAAAIEKVLETAVESDEAAALQRLIAHVQLWNKPLADHLQRAIAEYGSVLIMAAYKAGHQAATMSRDIPKPKKRKWW